MMRASKELPPRPYYNVYEKAIPLEDALDDSPMFRKKLKERENEVEDFASGVKRILKASKHYQTAANTYAETFKDFINEMANFKNSMGVNDDTLDKGFSHFISGLREIVSYQEFLGAQMEGLVSAPLSEFVNNDVKQTKECYKKYEKATSNMDSAVSKLGQVKKKNADKLSELTTEVEEAKKGHKSASLEATLQFNKVLAKKRFEFLERVCVYIQSQSTFFHQGYQFFTDNEPEIRDYSLYLQQTRKNFEDDTKKFEKQKTTLVDEAPLPRIPTTPSQTSSHNVMKGYLFKRSDDVININTWTRRYFVLKDGVLCYYKTGNEEQPDLSLPLLLCSVKFRPDMERRNCFEIVSPPDRSIILQAESDEFMSQWVQELQKSISISLNSQPSPAEERKKLQKSQSMDDQESPLAKLRSLSPANCVCADCSSKDPDWASFNLGAILCIDCSGVHRSLGVHISKVRSLSLDQWEPDLLDMMCGLGNEVVNSIYEAKTPEERPKPLSSDSRDIKNKYIRDKYEKKIFVKPFVPSIEHADEAAIKAEMGKILFEAIKNGDIKKVLELIVQGADLSFQNAEDEMQSPVHAAITAGNAPILLLLLMHNAQPDMKDAKDWTPLHQASDQGLANCAVLLLQKNTIHLLSAPDKEGNTPLELAMKKGNADCVTLLRLAQLARDEGATALEESFADALRQFSKDTRKIQS